MTEALKHVKGADALGKALMRFPVELRDKAMKGAIRAGSTVIQKDAQANAAKRSGEMAKGIKVRVTNKDDVLRANIATEGKHGYLANWVEHGTAAHNLLPKKGKRVLSFDVPGFGAFFFPRAQHPGAKPLPFMRPALDNRANDAISAIGRYIGRWVAKQDGQKLARGASVVTVEDAS